MGFEHPTKHSLPVFPSAQSAARVRWHRALLGLEWPQGTEQAKVPPTDATPGQQPLGEDLTLAPLLWNPLVPLGEPNGHLVAWAKAFCTAPGQLDIRGPFCVLTPIPGAHGENGASVTCPRPWVLLCCVRQRCELRGWGRLSVGLAYSFRSLCRDLLPFPQPDP